VLSGAFPFAEQIRFFGLGCLIGWASYTLVVLFRYITRLPTISPWTRLLVIAIGFSVLVSVLTITLLMFQRVPQITLSYVLSTLIPALLLTWFLMRIEG